MLQHTAKRPQLTTRELNAAAIRDPALRAAYASCRRLNARSGKTYFLATRLLTPVQRPAVHALYGFARLADDIVDGPPYALPARPTRRPASAPGTEDVRAARLDSLEEELRKSLRGGHSSHPVLAALVDTALRYRIAPEHFTDFMRSMRMDLRITDYPTYRDLRGYMHGSAAVIGLQVLPVLGAAVPRATAAPHAASLGVAFQLTNFLRDVGEDLDRGRVYVPTEMLSAHGVDRALLRWCRGTGRTDPRVRAALRDLAAVTRDTYRHAALGIPMLHPVSRPCVETAYVLYQGILDEIEAGEWAVLHRRAVVPRRRRAAVAVRGLARVALRRARRADGRPSAPEPDPGPPADPQMPDGDGAAGQTGSAEPAVPSRADRAEGTRNRRSPTGREGRGGELEQDAQKRRLST